MPSLRTGRLRLRLRLRDEQEPARGPPPLSSTHRPRALDGGGGPTRRGRVARDPISVKHLRNRARLHHPASWMYVARVPSTVNYAAPVQTAPHRQRQPACRWP
ncbi:MAG: hypothetical protein EXR72_20345 [Myxococcales bacterium]|nr:hypothetical protein [Myxococcales bacterium]